MPDLANPSGVFADVIAVAAGTSAAALQAIINAAPDGAHIILQEGTYRFTQTVVVNRDGITLEGQGNVVVVADASLHGAPALQIGQPLFIEHSGAPVHLTQAAADGANQVTVSDANTIHVGDTIRIEQPNDNALFAEIGDTQWLEDKPLRTGLAVVTAVDGSTITLDRAVPFDFAAGVTTVRTTEMVRDVTLRGITFQGDYGASDPADFSNSLTAEVGGMVVLVNASIGTTIEDIQILEAGSNGLVIGRSLDAQVSGLTVDGSHNKGDSGNGYGLWIRDVQDSSFTELTITDTRHAVLFASYTSAIGNLVHVTFTNRDINFHGALDHDNTVIVDQSIRNAVEQLYLGSVSFVNPGATYGAPTDPDANTILFGEVVGTTRADLVVALNSGAKIATMAANDTIIGGDGDDSIDAGTGYDLIYSSGGYDTIEGGSAADTLVLATDRSSALVLAAGGATLAVTESGIARISGIETLQFIDGSTGVAAVAAGILHGGTARGGQEIATTMVADSLVTAVKLTGDSDIAFVGNANVNRIIGNAGGNVIFGQDGNDRITGAAGTDLLSGGLGNDFVAGGAGNDTLLGGSGNDSLLGRANDDLLVAGAGNDTLSGGGGDDTLTGQDGADQFIASTGRNVVTDFSMSDGDTLVFNDFQTDSLIQSLDHWTRGTLTAADDFAFTETTWLGEAALMIASDWDTLILVGVEASDLYDYLLT